MPVRPKVKLSVIIPALNRRETLGEAIDSVLESLEGIGSEVIVVDDGSTDSTDDFISNNYSGLVSYKKIRRSGQSATPRNIGLNIASGKFVAFQDADDIWINRNLKDELKVFQNSKVVMAYANARHINADGSKHQMGTLVKPGQQVTGYGFAKIASKWPTPMPTPTVILRRSAIDKVGPFEERLKTGVDTEYWLRISSIGHIAYSNEIRALIRRDGKNTSTWPEEGGDKTLLVNELRRIDMFNYVLESRFLKQSERDILLYRIEELKLFVNEVASRMGEKSPYKSSDIKLQAKPGGLAKVDKEFESRLASRASRALRKVLGSSPGLYESVKKLIKLLVKPFRRGY